MDRAHFDDLARLVWTKQSRRAALGTLLGVMLLGHDAAPTGTAPKGKDNGKKKGNGKKNGKLKPLRPSNEPPCFPSSECFIGQGQDNSGCDFARETGFFERDLQGADLSHTNLTGAQLAGADLRGADLSGACLVNANLLDAVIDSSTHLEGATFCRTLMPNGSTNNSGCGKGGRCCPTPTPICRTCQGALACIRTPNTVCSIFGDPCCAGMSCTSTAAIGLTSCQAPCDTDQDCVRLFGQGVKCCARQTILCPFFPGGRCCQQPGELTCS